MINTETLIEKFQKIDDLIGTIAQKPSTALLSVNGVTAKTVHSNGYSITIAKWPQIIAVEYPTHFHDVLEILVVVKGVFKIVVRCLAAENNIEGACGGKEIVLTSGNSCVLNPKQPHSVTNMILGGEMVAICIPPDTMYRSLVDPTKLDIIQ